MQKGRTVSAKDGQCVRCVLVESLAVMGMHAGTESCTGSQESNVGRVQEYIITLIRDFTLFYCIIFFRTFLIVSKRKLNFELTQYEQAYRYKTNTIQAKGAKSGINGAMSETFVKVITWYKHIVILLKHHCFLRIEDWRYLGY